MHGGGRSRSRLSGVRRTLSKIAYAAQASFFAWEEGIVLHETFGVLSNGQLLVDLTFKRQQPSSNTVRRPYNSSRPVPRRSRKRPGWGIQEGHLKRLIILSR
jgi:hypothetical protein